MHHRTAPRILLVAGLGLLFAVGTAIGLGLSRTEGTPSGAAAPASGPASVGSGHDEAAVDPVTGVPSAGTVDADERAGDDFGSGDGGDRGDRDGRADPAGEPAPDDEDERAPAWNPVLPEPDLQPLPLPEWNPNPDGNRPDEGENGGGPPAPPPPPASAPLSVIPTRLGPGPIWEVGSQACAGLRLNTSTWIDVAVHQVPRATPYRIGATAVAGGARGFTRVEPAPNDPTRFRIHYGFPRGSVDTPAHPQVTITATDANGQRATVRVGGRPGIGHQLIPADHCM
jgi:hypothetical protein